RFGIEVCGGKEEDVGFGELGEGDIRVVSKIGEIGGDVGRELFGERGGDMSSGEEGNVYIGEYMAKHDMLVLRCKKVF
ncbi:hypothetical protein Tco_0440780, partial [Tanacetum coccineum]